MYTHPYPPPPGQPLMPADRCREVLLDDPGLSNAEAALLARSTPDQVRAVRRSLEDLGVLVPRRQMRRAFPQHVPLARSPRVLQEGAEQPGRRAAERHPAGAF